MGGAGQGTNGPKGSGKPARPLEIPVTEITMRECGVSATPSSGGMRHGGGAATARRVWVGAQHPNPPHLHVEIPV